MTTLAVPVGARDHVLGPKSAPVTLVEYGDFECPFCAQTYPVVKEIERQLGPRLRFVYRHFPLTSVHPHAEGAALAAESASAQGRFWEMHDALFQEPEPLREDDFDRYAEELGLDVPEFDGAMSARRFLPRVRNDFHSGVRSGVNGTPSFFINNVRHDSLTDFETLFSAVLNAMGA